MTGAGWILLLRPPPGNPPDPFENLLPPPGKPPELSENLRPPSGNPPDPSENLSLPSGNPPDLSENLSPPANRRQGVERINQPAYFHPPPVVSKRPQGSGGYAGG